MPDETLNRQPIGQPIGPGHQLPEHASGSRGRGFKIAVWVAILLIFAIGFWLVLRQKSNSATAAQGARRGGGGPVTVNIATAQKGDIGIYLNGIGTVTPTYTSSITSQVNGIITAVHYREGQFVRKGDALIDIDDRPYVATLMQAQGTLERDQNVLGQAQMDLQRYRDAWAKNAIQKQQLDDQEKIALQDQGTVKLDQGMVQYDQVQVDFCHIKAPISGRVGLRLVDPGNVVQSSGGTTLAVITQVQPITVIFILPEDSLGEVAQRLHKGAHLTVTAFDRSGGKQIAEGTLLTLDNQIDTTTGTVKARASFANKDGALYPNQFVNAKLLVDTLHDATLIPTSAIQHNGNESFVYVIQDNVAHMRMVKMGVTDGNTTQVTPLKEGDVKPGDLVANSSFDKLQENSKTVASKKPLPANASGSSAP